MDEELDGLTLAQLYGQAPLPSGVTAPQPVRQPTVVPTLSGNRNLTPELAEFIRRDAAAQGISNPVANFTGAGLGQKYGLISTPTTAAELPGMPSAPKTPLPVSASPAEVDALGLRGMLSKYLPSDVSPYAKDIAAARADAATQEKAFQDMIKQAAASQGEAAPSKSELYFRLAAAFGAPTRTGQFMEHVGLASKEMAEHAKETRTAKLAEKQRTLQLGIEAQKLRMQGAKEDLTTLRALEAQDQKGRSDFVRELVKDYVKSGQPQSEAGKVAADAGFKVGTPEYNNFVNSYVQRKLESGDWYKMFMAQVASGNLQVAQGREQRAAAESTMLTPAELKLKEEAENNIASYQSAQNDLATAFALNPKTFGGTKLEQAQRRALQEAGSKDPRLSNTNQVENLLGQQGLAKLRATFGGSPTEGERAILLDLEGINAKTTDDRTKIIARAYTAVKSRLERENKRLADINAGVYRSTGRTPTKEPQ
jgi:hypothetical protein